MKAIYTGDSKRYHKFEVVGEENFVGSLYVKKEGAVPTKVEVELISKGALEFAELGKVLQESKGR